jgi:hypothetical protein
MTNIWDLRLNADFRRMTVWPYGAHARGSWMLENIRVIRVTPEWEILYETRADSGD